MVKSRKFRRSVKGKKSKKTRSSIKRRMTRRKLRKSRSVRRGGDSGPPCYNNKGELDNIKGSFGEGGYSTKPGHNFKSGCPPKEAIEEELKQLNLNEMARKKQQEADRLQASMAALAKQEALRKMAYANEIQRESVEDTRTEQEKLDAMRWGNKIPGRSLTEQEKLDKMYWRNEYPDREQTQDQNMGMSWGERKGLGGKGRRRRRQRR